LLHWTQGDLARAAKLSLAAVNNLERDASNPRLRTLTQIQAALEAHGVEFQHGPGVRLRGEVFNVTTLDQGDVYSSLLVDVVNTCVAQKIPSACYMNVRDEDFVAANIEAFKDMARSLRRYGLKDHVLVMEGDTSLMYAPDITHYRWLPKSLFGVSPFVLYGTELAILLWGPPVRAIVMESPSVAATYAQQFEFFWEQSRDPPFSQKELYAMSEKLLPLG
jgi:transcriptional regulator with XRE-family HTH domain